MILNGTHGAIGVSKIRDLLNLNLGNSRTNPLVPKGQKQGRGNNKGRGKGRTQSKGQGTSPKGDARPVHPSSANAHPLGRRSTSITSGHELQEEQESDDTFWSAAIKTAMQNESRIPILAELSPTDIDPPKAIDQDEVQELCSIIETKDGEIPQNLCQHLAEILLTRFTVQDLSLDHINYVEVAGDGIGITIAMVGDLIADSPVFGMPPDFDGERHNMYKYSFAHGTDVTSAKMILPQGLIRPYTWDPTNPRDFPSFGFYGYGCLAGLSIPTATTLLKKIWKISKGKQGVVLLGEVVTAKEHGSLEAGGTTDEQLLVRRKAVVKGKERWCFHSNLAHIQMVAIIRPI